MPLPVWITQKVGPLPVWGWGALSLAGGVGFVLYKRRSTSAGLAGGTGPVGGPSSSLSPASGDAGGGPGGFGSGADDQGGGGLVGVPAGVPTNLGLYNQTPTTQLAPAPSVQTVTAPSTSAYRAGRQFDENPNQPGTQGMPQIYDPNQGVSGLTRKLLPVQLSNPAGSADYAASLPQNYYTPSQTDYATEQRGGISVVQAGLPGTQPSQGMTYTVYGANTGSGPVVPVSQRQPGERYDALGRVIL